MLDLKEKLLKEFDDIEIIDSHEHLEPEKEAVKSERDFFSLFSGYTQFDLISSELEEKQLEKLFEASEILPTLTKNSIDSFTRLRKELERVRNMNLAFDFEEALVGVNCVARPIRDPKNRILTAISISGPVSRMTKQKTPLFPRSTISRLPAASGWLT